jgi:hypothetical protein
MVDLNRIRALTDLYSALSPLTLKRRIDRRLAALSCGAPRGLPRARAARIHGGVRRDRLCRAAEGRRAPVK